MIIYKSNAFESHSALTLAQVGAIHEHKMASFEEDNLSISLKAYENGIISLGKLGQIIQLTKSDTMRLLNRLGICVADYDLDDELETLENL
jgi:predicted HTH domain antitoxin